MHTAPLEPRVAATAPFDVNGPAERFVNQAPANDAGTGLVVQLRTTALAELSAVDAGIGALRKKYGDVVFSVETQDGMEEAKAARIAIRESRYKIAPIVKAKRAELKTIAALLDTEGERISAALLSIETPIHEQIKAQEDLEEEQAKERKRIAEEEKARIDKAVDDMRSALTAAVGKSAAEIADLANQIEMVVITTELFGKRAGEAKQVQMNVSEALAAMHHTAVTNEAQLAELARLQADAAERTRIAAEAEEKRVKEEAERVAAQKKKDDAAAEAKRIETQQAADRLAAEQAKTTHAMTEVTRIQSMVSAAAADGTVETIARLLADAEAWMPTENAFGFLFQPAQLAKSAATTQLTTMLADAKSVAAEEAEAAEQQRVADAAAAAAQKKKDDDARTARLQQEADAAEARRLAAVELEKAQANALTLLASLRAIVNAVGALTDPEGELSCIPAGPERDELEGCWVAGAMTLKTVTA